MLSVRNFGSHKIQFALLVLLLAIPLTAGAQVTTATIVGTTSDPSGSIIPGAQITARNVDTGLTRTVTSGEDGSYRLEFLPVGNYALEVTTTGFKKAYLSGIVLRVNDTARVDIPLTVGQVTETVTVTETPVTINTSTPEIGRTIQSAEITSLPLV
ncbi:MAG TPA: carboxypeptidase-like regulatory domain-containing protein, partial [Pyrinomonadaceae bacterium]|nr:carboxypeptidase-like regulatory domain-containing protein [Pyrinomonadaceae bacterium]